MSKLPRKSTKIRQLRLPLPLSPAKQRTSASKSIGPELLAAFSDLEKKFTKHFPPHSIFIETDQEPVGEGFMGLVMVRDDKGDLTAKLFGKNMAVEEMLDNFIGILGEVMDRRKKVAVV